MDLAAGPSFHVHSDLHRCASLAAVRSFEETIGGDQIADRFRDTQVQTQIIDLAFHNRCQSLASALRTISVPSYFPW